VRTFLLFMLIGSLAACGGDKDSGTTTTASTDDGCGDAPAPDGSGTTGGDYTPAKGTAAVKGVVKWDGKPPLRRTLDMGADKYCAKCQDGSKKSKTTIVGPDGGLKDVFVHVKSGLKGWTFPAPTGDVILDQHECTYTPHMIGIRTGQTLRIRNSDPILHNVHAVNVKTKRDAFNIGQPKEGTEDTKSFRKPGFLSVKCDVHGWMSASICVVNHPFFRITGEDGAFALDKLPPGTYTIEAWHAKWGSQTQDVTVKEGETSTVSFTFSKRKRS